jgi:ankyrin repeat protein
MFRKCLLMATVVASLMIGACPPSETGAEHKVLSDSVPRPGSKALFEAASYGNLKKVRHLVSIGFDPLQQDAEGRSSYVMAAMGNHIAIVDFFWKNGVRPPEDDEHIGTILWSAGLWSRKPILEYYLGKGVDINAEHFGYTALIAAAQSGHLDLVKWLIGKGAKRKSSSDVTALDEARTHKRQAVVEYLQSLDAR